MEQHEEQKIELTAAELATMLMEYCGFSRDEWTHQKTEAPGANKDTNVTWLHITLRKREVQNATENQAEVRSD